MTDRIDRIVQLIDEGLCMSETQHSIEHDEYVYAVRRCHWLSQAGADALVGEAGREIRSES